MQIGLVKVVNLRLRNFLTRGRRFYLTKVGVRNSLNCWAQYAEEQEHVDGSEQQHINSEQHKVETDCEHDKQQTYQAESRTIGYQVVGQLHILDQCVWQPEYVDNVVTR